MATRRARIKVAPNLAAARSKARIDPDKCKDHVIKNSFNSDLNGLDGNENFSAMKDIKIQSAKNIIVPEKNKLASNKAKNSAAPPQSPISSSKLPISSPLAPTSTTEHPIQTQRAPIKPSSQPTSIFTHEIEVESQSFPLSTSKLPGVYQPAPISTSELLPAPTTIASLPVSSQPAPTTTADLQVSTKPAPGSKVNHPVSSQPAPTTTADLQVSTKPAPGSTVNHPVSSQPAPTTTADLLPAPMCTKQLVSSQPAGTLTTLSLGESSSAPDKNPAVSSVPKQGMTAEFVNGKYLPVALSAVPNANNDPRALENVEKKDKNVEVNDPLQSTPADTDNLAETRDGAPLVEPTSQPAKPVGPTIRRFLGLKNKFKPNLFSRSKQAEESLRRDHQLPPADHYLPPADQFHLGQARTRKNSVGDKKGEVNARLRKNSTGEVEPTSPLKSPGGDSCARKSSMEDVSMVTRSRKNSMNEVDSQSISSRARKVSFSDPVETVTAPAGEEAHARARRASGAHSPSPVTGDIFTDRRMNRKRMRSLSGSNSSGDESCQQGLKRPPSVDRRDAVENWRVATPLLDAETPLAGKSRIRRITDTKSSYERTNFLLKRRKCESKSRFSNGVPGRGTMTMFDLIYYNPDNGTEMATDEPEQQVVTREEAHERIEDLADGAASPSRDEESALPVPQVKVSANGEIILDESSTMLETTAAKRAKQDLCRSPAVVENANRLTNYGTWSKKRRYSDWSERETFRFYRALSIVGSDFSMMESMFKKRTRHELKLKFKKEEKVNSALVDKCLSQRGQFTDITDFMAEDSEEEEEKVDRPGRGRKRKVKGTRKKKFSSRGMYDSSSGGEEADVSETSRSPAGRRRRTSQIRSTPTQRTPPTGRCEAAGRAGPAGSKESSRYTPKFNSRAPSSSSSRPPPAEQLRSAVVVSSPLQALEKLPNVHFPPALLAANPGLAGAKPGSLVVVASPSKTDPSSQLLHVYMVSEKKKRTDSAPRADTPASGTPRTGSPARSRALDPGRLSIDPAVVRAVDRKRSSVDRNQKAGLSPLATEGGSVYRRQRTMSEGNVISPSRIGALTQMDCEDPLPYTRTRTFGTSLATSSHAPSTAGPTPRPVPPPSLEGREGGDFEVSREGGDLEVSKEGGDLEVSKEQLPIARKSKPPTFDQ